MYFGQFQKGELRDKKICRIFHKKPSVIVPARNVDVVVSRPPLTEFSGSSPERASESDFSYLELSGVNL